MFCGRRFFHDDICRVKIVINRVLADFNNGACPIPTLLVQQMLVSAEDHRAGKHPGFDMVALLRAVYVFMVKGEIQGGSTIAQQLVRVVSGRYERTFWRKVREIIVASLICDMFPREYLPAVYLSIAYYGVGMSGYAAACRRLNINTSVRAVEDAAKIIARLKYPQPKFLIGKAAEKLARRERHITHLYFLHKESGVHEYLGTETVFKY